MDSSKLNSTVVRRQGTVLIIVLVVIVLLTLSAYTFTSLMRTEREVSIMMTRRLQSKYLIDSGIDYTRLLLSYDNATIHEKGGLWNNETGFREIQVSVNPDNPDLVGRFTIISPGIDDEGNPMGFRYGLTDESSKLNVNVLPIIDNFGGGGAARELLMSLPNMNEEVADRILDFLDEDDEPREFGVESAYYNGLTPPYNCKNGPLDSLDELLLVDGVTPDLLFGNDRNRNGVIDLDESQGDTILDADMELGWINYLTLYSKESNLNSEKQVRVNINNPDLERLYDDLGASFDEQWRLFVVMARVNGLFYADQLEEGVEPVTNVPLVELDFDTLESSTTFNQVLQLVNAFTTMQDPTSGETITLASPIQQLDPSFPVRLLAAMDNMTAYEGEAIPGRINIMQAPRRILLGIPGLDEETVDTIITRRQGDYELLAPEGVDIFRQHETWLLSENVVDLATMQIILPFVCTGGEVYKAEVVGYFNDLVGATRAEVFLDATQPLPRILFWRDKSHLPIGYSIDILGRDLIEQ